MSLFLFFIVGPEGIEPPCYRLRFLRIMSARRYEPNGTDGEDRTPANDPVLETGALPS